MNPVTSPELSIVLPAYEEAANLTELLPEIHRVAGSLTPSYEIIVVDACEPRDNTPEVCAAQRAKYVARTGGAMYGHAVATAQSVALGRWVMVMDSDGSHNPKYISDLWAQREEHDLVIGSRYTAGGQTENPAILIFLSLVVNVVFRVVLGLSCRDVSNSFRLYRGVRFREVELQCEHFDVVEELLVKLLFSEEGCRFKEVPMTFEKRRAGETKRNLVTFAIGYIGTLSKLYSLKRRVQAQGYGSATRCRPTGVRA